MNCPNCKSLSKKNGKDRKGNQRFYCLSCGKTYTTNERMEYTKLPVDRVEMIAKLLIEGNSIRLIEKITNVHRDLIIHLIKEIGMRCLAIQKILLMNTKVVDIDEDGESWRHTGINQKTSNKQDLYGNQVGNAYTFTAIDPKSKLIVAWDLGKRREENARIFLKKIYAINEPISYSFGYVGDFRFSEYEAGKFLGTKADYDQFIKLYVDANPYGIYCSGADFANHTDCVSSDDSDVKDAPISVLRIQNLRLRMSICRLTHSTNDFSSKWDNLKYILALHFAYYNFCRIHKTIDCTPAMKAGITKMTWRLSDFVNFPRSITQYNTSR